jgi:multimeric flavodoxin WrbA
MSVQKLVLLNGSPKGRGGSSGSFGKHILDRIPGEGRIKEIHHVGKAIQNKEKWKGLVNSIMKADTIILTFPLYWDSLPSHLTKALERIYFDYKESNKSPNFYVIVHNGFPEPWHNEVAIDICHCFSKKIGYKWQGAINIGGGAAIAGRPLEETGGTTLKLRETLDIAVKAISKGEPISDEVKNRLAKPLYPPWFNMVFVGIGWRRMARKKGAKTSLRAKPYQR